MSDDRWRRNGRDEDPESSEFGGPLFPDDPADDERHRRRERSDRSVDTLGSELSDPGAGERRLRFGPDDTGPLPHWTDPPTGEVPRLEPRGGAGAAADDDADEVDVWSTFTTESPVWRDDDENMVTGVIEQIPSDFGAGQNHRVGREPSDVSGAVERPSMFDRGADDDPTGGVARDDEPSRPFPRSSGSGGLFDDDADADDGYGRSREPSGSVPRTGSTAERGRLTGEVPLQARREPGRITIGTDPSGMPRRSPDPRRRPGTTRSGRPIGPARTSAPPSQRNMSAAVIAGGVIAAVFVVSLLVSAAFTMVIAALILAVAGWEYFGKVTEKGYRPAVAPGLAACALAPVAGYFYGHQALPLVLALAFVAAAIGFVASPGVESGPLPNMAVTTMGVVWIGMLGGFAGAILSLSWAFPGSNLGTDTMFMVALGVAANDIGALMVGSAIGRTPLRAWVSPSKTVEGLVGGTIVTFFALFIAAQIVSGENAWSQNKWVLLLAVVISVLAPLGDLTESMFKRNLEIKDFGSIVQGHGGVLDRFDGFLFVLPAAYYLTLVLLF